MDEPVSPDQFRAVMGLFASGVTIVTTRDLEGRPYGLTVSSFTSVSLEPPLVLVCLDNRLSGLEDMKQRGRFGVNILSQAQQELSTHFATRGSDRSQAPYTEGTTGIPMLGGSLAGLECQVTSLYPAGDHTIFLGEVHAVQIPSAAEDPLLYFSGGYRALKETDG